MERVQACEWRNRTLKRVSDRVNIGATWIFPDASECLVHYQAHIDRIP